MSERAGKLDFRDALDAAVKQAQTERARTPSELVMGPETAAALQAGSGVPFDAPLTSYQGIPVRVSNLLGDGEVYALDEADMIRGAKVTEAVYDEAGRIEPSAFLRSATAKVSIRDAAGVMRQVGEATIDTAESFREFAEAALAVSGRMLPPPEWQDRAVRAAQTAGLDLEWCQHVSGTAGRTDTWAHVSTKRGGFDVRPGAGESWTQALAAAGIVVELGHA